MGGGSVVRRLRDGLQERPQMHFLMCIAFSIHEQNKLTTSLADTLDRYEVPFFGPLASRFVDDE